MARKLTHAPVYFAIMQARFNPILALDSYAPQIQERLRKHGFPDLSRKASWRPLTSAWRLPTEGSAPQAPVAQTARYIFCNMDRTAGLISDQNALSFQTTEYDVFEKFSGEFRQGLQAVHDAVDLSYTDRIGFRYLDAVFPKAKSPGRLHSTPPYLDWPNNSNRPLSTPSLRRAYVQQISTSSLE